MSSFLRRLPAALAILVLAACASGGLQQTPLPSVEGQSAGQMPPSSPSSSEQSDDSETSDVSTDGAPVSGPHAAAATSPGAAPATTGRPQAANATHAATAQAAVQPRLRTQPQRGFRYACRHDAVPGRRECDTIVRAQSRNGVCNRIAPYCASDLQSAYGIVAAAKSGGKAVTVAVVDAYGYSGAASDLAVYRKAMGLPACSAASGCLKIVNQSGRSTALPAPNADANDDWRPQQAVDLDMVSAICPNCRILLVQANSGKNADLAASVGTAVALGAVAIGNSYSGGEENGADAAYAHNGRAIVASAGNDGTGSKQPCSYAGVVCVGGTTLRAVPGGRGWSEGAWRSGGSGCSSFVSKPSWQRMRGCSMRVEADVAAVADPATGVAFYQAPGGWQQAGGTGVSAPIVAAIFALGPSAARANAPQWIWRHGGSAAYHDIVAGENGECVISYVCRARAGYDGPTGWGTPARVAGW